MKERTEIENIKTKIENEFLILLEEEYGYREWFWFPEMSEEELITWWERLESVDSYFMTPEPLIGTLFEVKEGELYNFFYQLIKKQIYMNGHIHMDDDSYLKKANAEGYIYHKGYSGDSNFKSESSTSLEEMRLIHERYINKKDS